MSMASKILKFVAQATTGSPRQWLGGPRFVEISPRLGGKGFGRPNTGSRPKNAPPRPVKSYLDDSRDPKHQAEMGEYASDVMTRLQGKNTRGLGTPSKQKAKKR